MKQMDLESRIRAVLARVGRLTVPIDRLGRTSDLFDAGLTSQAAVEVVFDLEDAFGVELPDEALTRRSLATIAELEATFAAAQVRS